MFCFTEKKVKKLIEERFEEERLEYKKQLIKIKSIKELDKECGLK